MHRLAQESQGAVEGSSRGRRHRKIGTGIGVAPTKNRKGFRYHQAGCRTGQHSDIERFTGEMANFLRATRVGEVKAVALMEDGMYLVSFFPFLSLLFPPFFRFLFFSIWGRRARFVVGWLASGFPPFSLFLSFPFVPP